MFVPVAQEMSPEERRTRLLHSFRASQSAEEGIVDFSQLAHAVGMDEAEKLVINLTAMDSIIRVPHSKRPRYVSQGMATVNIRQAIEVIQRVSYNEAKSKISNKLKNQADKETIFKSTNSQ